MGSTRRTGALHAVDVVLRQQGGVVPETIITDTGSYSDIVFGLLHLLGRQYRPQLANLPDQRLWRIDPAADYGPLDRAARGRIDTDRVVRHWEDMCRVAVSIHSGEVSAHEVTRMISRDGNPTSLGQAIAHYGRIFKTLHILPKEFSPCPHSVTASTPRSPMCWACSESSSAFSSPFTARPSSSASSAARPAADPYRSACGPTGTAP
ncbi:Tn3 family transposase [Pseudonocardia nigra]|uniref:Tn3 family transposase n=1 Tax=Pseudonocardia nigra TaxID=1921578 RepID=UPI0027E32957|nr:Tn3 family transposase [Pseudonocardia nigra]